MFPDLAKVQVTAIFACNSAHASAGERHTTKQLMTSARTVDTGVTQQLHSYTAAAQQADYYLTPRSAPFQVEGVGARPYHHLHDVWAHLKPNIVKIIRDVSSDHR